MKGGTSPGKRGHKTFSRSPKRLVRRSTLPRSRKTNALSPERVGDDEVSSVEDDAAPEACTSTMNFYPPTAGVPTDFQLPPGSSTSTLGTTPATAPKGKGKDKGKKKPNFFSSLRSTKERSGSITSIESPLDMNTLPLNTPTKAARLLGLGADTSSASSINSDSGINQDSGGQSGAPVRPAMRRQASMPLLTRIKGFAKSKSTKLKKGNPNVNQTRFEETPHVSGNNKAFSSSSSLGLSSGGLQGHATNLPSSSRSNEGNMADKSNENNSQRRLDRVPVGSRPFPERRKRKKQPKSLDRMSPITEASHGDLNTAYRNSEHTTELDVISEYEYGYTPHGASVLPRSRTESMLTTGNRYNSTGGSLSLAELAIEKDDESDPDAPHPGARVKMNYMTRPAEPTDPHPGVWVNIDETKWPSMADLYERGPLQTLEHQLLDSTQKDLQENKHVTKKLESCKASIDAEVFKLRESHERMRNEISTMLSPPPRNPRRLQQAHTKAVEEAMVETADNDAASIGSSIDSGYDCSVHEVEYMPCTRVLPGTSKLVDIPPRRNKAGPAIPAIVRIPPTPRITGSKFCVDCDEKIEIHTEKTENFEVSTAIPLPSHTLTRSQPVLPSKLFEATPYEQFTRSDRIMMSPEDSRKYTQQWISSSPHPSEQHSDSASFAGLVLSSRQNPPTAPPKDGSRPIKKTGKHSCLKNGHLFYGIDINAIADRVSLNTLGVQPYLVTPSGQIQAVKVPVKCEKCDKNIGRKAWQCEIPVCRLTVCKKCARGMEEEWQERIVDDWKLSVGVNVFMN